MFFSTCLQPRSDKQDRFITVKTDFILVSYEQWLALMFFCFELIIYKVKTDGLTLRTVLR